MTHGDAVEPCPAVGRRHDVARGVAGAAIADYGVVVTPEVAESLPSGDAVATDAVRASRLVLAEAVFDRGAGDARLFGGVSSADADVVGS